MKRLICILLFIPMLSMAQGGGQHRGEKIQAAKIGLITERLNLTPEQAPQFWAVYNEYDSKRTELRRSIRRTMGESSSLAATDDKITNSQKQVLVLRKKELELEEEYMAKILKTITPRQFAELKQTESNFNKMLIEKLKERGDN